MKTGRKGIVFALLALSLLCTVALLQAGAGYDVTCKSENCGFKINAKIGGGRAFEEASGYCARCDKWVSVTWKRQQKAPAPLFEFWDPETGQTRQIRKCPDCAQPFVVIKAIGDMKFCPKCQKPNLESKRTIMYD